MIESLIEEEWQPWFVAEENGASELTSATRCQATATICRSRVVNLLFIRASS
jgi:hypothetical protein